MNFWARQDEQTNPKRDPLTALELGRGKNAPRYGLDGRRAAQAVRRASVALIFFAITTMTALAGQHHTQLAQVTTITSWYGRECLGRTMANGKPFDPNALTCASWDYPLGARIKVCHKNRVVFVTITDRGPARRLYRQGRKLDLSRAAFQKLADPKLGLIKVTIERIP